MAAVKTKQGKKVFRKLGTAFAEQLVRKRKYSDMQVFELVNAAGFKISSPSYVGSFRNNLGIQPIGYKKLISSRKKAKALALQMLKQGKLSDMKISKTLRAQGKRLSAITVGKMRRKLVSAKKLVARPKSQRAIERGEIMERSRVIFRIMGKEQLLRKAKQLIAQRELLKRRYRSAIKFREKRRFLAFLSETEIMIEALSEFVPPKKLFELGG